VKAGAIAFAALVAIAAGAMALAGANPIDGFAALIRGGLFDYRHPFDDHRIAETLVQTTALLFPALAVAFAFRAGLFNIGAEGQLIIGGLAAGIVGARVHAPGPIAILCALGAGAIGGALWAAIAGVLRARFGGNEVIATLMLNIVAALLANYLIVGPLHSPGVAGAETAVLPVSAWLPTLLPGTRLTIALPLALGVAVLVRVFFARSVLGYELRAAGDAPEAARRAGIDLGRVALVAMAVSGAIAGIGGATIVDGVLHRFNVALSPGYGFIAIAVALVGRLDPLRIIAAAFVFGILQSGSVTMQAAANVPRDVVTFVEGLAILALAAQQYVARRGRTATA
jgi:simple sugar transport system permease protein